MNAAFPYVTAMLLSHTARESSTFRCGMSRGRSAGRTTTSAEPGAGLEPAPVVPTWPIYFVAGFLPLAVRRVAGLRGMYVTTRVLLDGTSVPGWASTVVIQSFFNAPVLLSLVILGLYLSRLTQQVTRSRVSFTIGEIHE